MWGLVLFIAYVNPLVTNRLSYPYHLDESISILGASGVILFISITFSMKFVKVNRIAVSHLELFCLPMSHKKDAMLKFRECLRTHTRKVFTKDKIVVVLFPY